MRHASPPQRCTYHVTPGAARLVWLVALVVGLVGLQVFAEALVPLLSYRREAVLQGEVWRLLSAHAVHLGWMHLMLNLLALGVVLMLVGQGLSALRWWWAGMLSAVGTSAVLLARPDIVWYLGLSGVVHGLLAAGAVGLWRRFGAWAALPWVLVLASKLAWEQWQGVGVATARLIGGEVLVDAHLYGALSGVVAGWALSRRDSGFAKE
jgi:rhomboid family GlyGly-CTERM serine protease